jgi:Family of unknown function (DUF695)
MMRKPNLDFDTIAWSIAKGLNEGHVFIMRFRAFEPGFPRSSFPQRLNIFWTVKSPTGKGLPSPEDSDKLNIFEDRLVDAVEPDSHSILSMVLTGKSRREYVFHTTNPQEFLNRLTDMPQENDRYPIEIILTEDPEWEYFDRARSDIKR